MTVMELLASQTSCESRHADSEFEASQHLDDTADVDWLKSRRMCWAIWRSLNLRRINSTTIFSFPSMRSSPFC